MSWITLNFPSTTTAYPNNTVATNFFSYEISENISAIQNNGTYITLKDSSGRYIAVWNGLFDFTNRVAAYTNLTITASYNPTANVLTGTITFLPTYSPWYVVEIIYGAIGLSYAPSDVNGGVRGGTVVSSTMLALPSTGMVAPAAPSVTAAAEDSAVTLTITPPANAAALTNGFVYQVETFSNSNYTTRVGTAHRAVYAASTSSIRITGLTNNTPYWFKVYAKNTVGTGTATATASPSVLPSAPVTPPPTTPAVVPCFFGNARVLTPSGYRRMDSLKVGDSVVTPRGVEVAIERVKVSICPAGPNTNPYVIPAGTFGATHRLLISPDHKVCLPDGRRVEAKRLGLEQETREGSLTYYNLELAGQADMVVGGVAVESLAPVRRVVMSMAAFEAAVKSRYGGLTPVVIANIKRTCRLVGPNAVEVPILRR